MKKYLCVHGHFYQPPRENPWLETIEIQDSAFPYHDWNERITAQCYAPNAASRILDGNGKISEIVNNFSNISFDFGPTLLSWIEFKQPKLLETIVKADEESRQRFSGHGTAIAQGFHHIILPLANRRDKETQVIWGIKDFEFYFKRQPEGMWLPEAAVDTETLEILAEQGIKYTILAPNQAKAVRGNNNADWQDVSGERIDTTKAYLCRLPSGNTINLFFYDGPTAKAISFENLLESGDALADRLDGLYSHYTAENVLINVATDGETYGHHRAFADMALAYALKKLETDKQVILTNYGEFLEQHPPTDEVQIFDNSSWSCAHGVERWRSDCGCNSGMHGGWRQQWRAPLRAALDWLRDSCAPLYEKSASEYLKDPWVARNDYIDVIHNRDAKNIEEFFAKHAHKSLTRQQICQCLLLLELQRHCLLMYTSCGWFFDEISGLETTQVIQYACRVIQLAKLIFEQDFEPKFLELLAEAPSNIPEYANGRKIYELFVKPTQIELNKVAAHVAIAMIFDDYSDQAAIYCYDIQRRSHESLEAGKIKLLVGSIQIKSRITTMASNYDYAVLYSGDHNIYCAIRPFDGDEKFTRMKNELVENFSDGEFLELIHIITKHFGLDSFSLKDLFRDEQRRIVTNIVEATTEELLNFYQLFYQNHMGLIQFLFNLSVPISRELLSTCENIITTQLKALLQADDPDYKQAETLLEQAEKFNFALNIEEFNFLLVNKTAALAEQFEANPQDNEVLQKIVQVVKFIDRSSFNVVPWHLQNVLYRVINSDEMQNSDKTWQTQIQTLTRLLHLK